MKKRKIVQVGIVSLTGICSVYSWTLPITSNFCELVLSKKLLTVLSLICGAIFLTLVITNCVKNGKMDKRKYMDIFYVSPLALMELINLLMCFNYQLWGQKPFVVGVALLWVLFVELYAGVRTLFNKSLEKETTPIILVAIAVLSFVVAVVNESAGNYVPASLCYKISVGLAYLIAVALYTHKYIYKSSGVHGRISSIIGIVFWGMIITVTFPFYIKWCGLTEDAFQSFVSVYSAVLGGGITLAGVAWTIKDTNDKRKEEERKKHIPYLTVVPNAHDEVLIHIPITEIYDFNKIEDRKVFKDNIAYSVHFEKFTIKNISNAHILLTGIMLNDCTYIFDGILVEKDTVYQVAIANSGWINLTEPLKSVVLIAEDMIGNNYFIMCDTTLNRTESGDEETDDGEKYRIIARSYIVGKTQLPKCVAEK